MARMNSQSLADAQRKGILWTFVGLKLPGRRRDVKSYVIGVMRIEASGSLRERIEKRREEAKVKTVWVVQGRKALPLGERNGLSVMRHMPIYRSVAPGAYTMFNNSAYNGFVDSAQGATRYHREDDAVADVGALVLHPQGRRMIDDGFEFRVTAMDTRWHRDGDGVKAVQVRDPETGVWL